MNFLHTRDTEVFILQGESRQELMNAAKHLLRGISSSPPPELKDLAFTLNCPLQASARRLAIVAHSLQDLEKKTEPQPETAGESCLQQDKGQKRHLLF